MKFVIGPKETLLLLIMSGWPNELNTTDVSLAPYWNRKMELSTQEGVILWGNRVVVPPQGRDYILEELHAGHPGIAHMKKIARMFVWWPHMDSNIETCVKSCSECQSQRPAPPASQFILGCGQLDHGTDCIWTLLDHLWVICF